MAKELDGIDLEAMNKTIEIIQDQPDKAAFKFRASNHWIEGTHNRAVVKGFYGFGEEHGADRALSFDEDEPAVVLGHDQGANPVEFVLVGLSGCLTTALVAQAAARGITLRSVESEIEGDIDLRGFMGLDPNVRNGYQQIRMRFTIDADASEAQIQELVELAQLRSPVFDIVSHPTPVIVEAAKKG